MAKKKNTDATPTETVNVSITPQPISDKTDFFVERNLTPEMIQAAENLIKHDAPQPGFYGHEDFAFIAEAIWETFYANGDNAIDPHAVTPTIVMPPPATLKGYFPDPEYPLGDMHIKAYVAILRHATTLAVMKHGEDKLEFLHLHFLAGDDPNADPYRVQGKHAMTILDMLENRELDDFGAWAKRPEGEPGFKNGVWLAPEDFNMDRDGNPI